LGPLFESVVRVEGVPPEEISRRKDAYFLAVFNELKKTLVLDSSTEGLRVINAVHALHEHELKTLKAELARLEMKVIFGS